MLRIFLDKPFGLDWLLSLKYFFSNVAFHTLGAVLTLMALFSDGLVLTEPSELD